jgi:hypothetical protein
VKTSRCFKVAHIWQERRDKSSDGHGSAWISTGVLPSVICLDLIARPRKQVQMLDFLFPETEVETLGQIRRCLGQGCYGTVYELHRPEHKTGMP